MNDSDDNWPKWVAKALQGVAFWVGHRRSMYSSYALSEGALTAELCNLIYANLQKDYRLRCELSYEKFLPDGVKPADIVSGKRVDLSVWKRYLVVNGRYRRRPIYVIEVKRANAGKTRIDQDLQRLAFVVKESDEIRAFLFVISEGKRPQRFVNERGHAKNKHVKIVGTNSTYSVLQVWKASRSFSSVEEAHYACLIEVVSGR
jgi:hypothetical protein